MTALSRQANKFYANTFGYFWLPCPVCGQEFGGHEWSDVGDMPSSFPIGPSKGRGMCTDCTRDGFGYPYEVTEEWFPPEWWNAQEYRGKHERGAR